MTEKYSSRKQCSRRPKRVNVARTTTHTGFICLVENKKMYMRRNAEIISKAMRRNLDSSHHVYHCPHCSHHHIGSNSKKGK